MHSYNDWSAWRLTATYRIMLRYRQFATHSTVRALVRNRLCRLRLSCSHTFRADRNPRIHVGFGYRAHMCLGAPLARMEARAVLRELVNRVSRISATGPMTWSTNSSLRGPTRLPVVLQSIASVR